MAGLGKIVCCDCDHLAPEADFLTKKAKESRHEQSEVGHFCLTHRRYECSMIAVSTCKFTCTEEQGLSMMVDHIVNAAGEERHKIAVGEMLYQHLDD